MVIPAKLFDLKSSVFIIVELPISFGISPTKCGCNKNQQVEIIDGRFELTEKIDRPKAKNWPQSGTVDILKLTCFEIKLKRHLKVNACKVN